ncbi:MAG: alpha-N-acetylglucosaminidase [Armatimonadetes bacterium]|nr:alpha-N-acetylglucosaminidase [Armatimonadota bacterium]
MRWFSVAVGWLVAGFALAVPDGAKGVIERTVGPVLASNVVIAYEESPTVNAIDYYEVSASGGKVSILASSPVAACRGFYEYLKITCKTQLDRATDTVKLPAVWPDYVRTGKICPAVIRYFDGQSIPDQLWNWNRWEREIDWMALHGLNAQVQSANRDKTILTLIAQRASSLGIRTIIQIPMSSFFEIKDHEPPLSPATRVNLRSLTEVIGNLDSYALAAPEEIKRGWLPTITDNTKAVFDFLSLGDLKATLFVKSRDLSCWTPAEISEMLGAAPEEKLIVLDSANAWQKNPKIANTGWILMPTFGNSLKEYGESVWTALRSERQGYLRGMGISRPSPIVAELMTDLMWSNTQLNLRTWLSHWVSRRYGFESGELTLAWETLGTLQSELHQPFWSQLPTDKVTAGSVQHRETLRFLVKSFQLASLGQKANSKFNQDFADITALWLGSLADLSCYMALSTDGRISKGHQLEFMKLLSELDEILAQVPDYRINTWLADFDTLNASNSEKSHRNKLVRSSSFGVSSTNYAGVVGSLYKARWKLFFESPANSRVARIERFEETWINSSKPIIESKAGDVQQVVKKLLKKYPATP